MSEPHGSIHPERAGFERAVRDAIAAAHGLDNDGARHRAKAVLVVPPVSQRTEWFWRARCDLCGPVALAHHPHRPDPADARRYRGPDEPEPATVGFDEAYRRARADAAVHEAYPRGVAWGDGLEIELR